MDINNYSVQLEHAAVHVGDNMPSMHAHPQHELYFLNSGQRRYFVGHTIYDVAPGNLVIVPRTQLHRTTTPSRKGYDRYLVFFSESEHAAFIDTVGRAPFNALIQSGCLSFPANMVRQIQRDLELLEQELSSPTPTTRAMAAHLLHDILLTALRHGKRKEPFHGESADKVQQAARYISAHYAEPLTLSDAARLACMEQTYFSKRFKALTGFGFHEYLTQTRLRCAEQLLLETSLSIGEIAERHGFKDPKMLSQHFKEIYGCTPSEKRTFFREVSRDQ